jgi:hypothetical protein
LDDGLGGKSTEYEMDEWHNTFRSGLEPAWREFTSNNTRAIELRAIM